MGDRGSGNTLQWERCLCSQLLVPTLAGVPAFYLLPMLLTSRTIADASPARAFVATSTGSAS